MTTNKDFNELLLHALKDLVRDAHRYLVMRNRGQVSGLLFPLARLRGPPARLLKSPARACRRLIARAKRTRSSSRYTRKTSRRGRGSTTSTTSVTFSTHPFSEITTSNFLRIASRLRGGRRQTPIWGWLRRGGEEGKRTERERGKHDGACESGMRHCVAV